MECRSIESDWGEPFVSYSAPGARGDLFVHSFTYLAINSLAHMYYEPSIRQSHENWTFMEGDLWNRKKSKVRSLVSDPTQTWNIASSPSQLWSPVCSSAQLWGTAHSFTQLGRLVTTWWCAEHTSGPTQAGSTSRPCSMTGLSLWPCLILFYFQYKINKFVEQVVFGYVGRLFSVNFWDFGATVTWAVYIVLNV